MLPYFIRSEANQNQELAKNSYHGSKGPMKVSDSNGAPELQTAFFEACEELGLKRNDFNGGKQEGYGRNQQTGYHGTRSHTARAYLRPAMIRQNIHVLTKATARKVLFHGMRAVGVEYEHHGSLRTVLARKEVILSAGAMETPKLLMLSGIGPKKDLESLGIKVIKDAPVGNNLQNHVLLDGVGFGLREPISITPNDVTLTELVKFNLFGTGVLSTTLAEGIAYLRTPNQPKDDPRPYMSLMLFASTFGVNPEAYEPTRAGWNLQKQVFDSINEDMFNNETFLVVPMPMQVLSRGSVKLNSTKFEDPLLIDTNYYDDPTDIKVMIDSIRMAQKFASTTAFEKIGAKLLERVHSECRDMEYDSDAYWECYILHTSMTHWHQAGTCKMGGYQDATAPLDPKLRVKGVTGLRVVDASIMPRIVGGTINAAVIAIAERAADIIKGLI